MADRELYEIEVPDALTGGATPIPRIVASVAPTATRGQTPIAKLITATDEKGATPIPRVPPAPLPKPASPPQKK